MAESKSIADLKSLGPKSQEMLARVGVTSIAQLRALGSVPAYVMAKKANRKVGLFAVRAVYKATILPPRSTRALPRSALVALATSKAPSPAMKTALDPGGSASFSGSARKRIRSGAK